MILRFHCLLRAVVTACRSPLWDSFRAHPRFAEMLAKRAGIDQEQKDSLAAVLEGCSPGGQNVWPQLKQGALDSSVSFVVGELDSKFVSLAEGIVGSKAASEETLQPQEPSSAPGWCMWAGGSGYRVAEVGCAGHAVHIEQPVALASALCALLDAAEADAL